VYSFELCVSGGKIDRGRNLRTHCSVDDTEEKEKESIQGEIDIGHGSFASLKEMNQLVIEQANDIR
jgi:hypothetical protein